MDNSPMWDLIMQRMHLRAGQIPTYKRAETHTVSPLDRPSSASALCLASDDSSYVTGSTLFVNSGMLRHAGTL